MVALQQLALCFLFFATGLVTLDAAITGQVVEKLRSDKVKITTDFSKLVRRQAHAAGAARTVAGNVALDEDDPPCNPYELLALQADPKAGGHAAATLSGKVGNDSPCAKLAKRITPTIAYKHVIIKEPDGNTSQVPDEEDDREMLMTVARTNIVWYLVNSLFWCFTVCTLFGICYQRLSQDSKAKRIKKSREADREVDAHAAAMDDGEDAAERVEAMIKAGASAGAISAVQKAAAKRVPAASSSGAAP